jgi:hypothetical protein
VVVTAVGGGTARDATAPVDLVEGLRSAVVSGVRGPGRGDGPSAGRGGEGGRGPEGTATGEFRHVKTSCDQARSMTRYAYRVAGEREKSPDVGWP